MAKAKIKCTEIEAAIAEFALDIATIPDHNGELDAVVAAMNKELGDGGLNRTIVADAVFRYTKRQAELNANEEKQRIAKFKQEVRDDREVNFAIDNYAGQLETGFFQGSAPLNSTSKATRALKALRKRRNKMQSEKKLQERIAVVEKKMKERDLAHPTRPTKNDDPYFDYLRARLADANRELREMRGPNMAANQARLEKQIATIEKKLAEHTPAENRTVVGPKEELVAHRDDLVRQLAQQRRGDKKHDVLQKKIDEISWKIENKQFDQSGGRPLGPDEQLEAEYKELRWMLDKHKAINEIEDAIRKGVFAEKEPKRSATLTDRQRRLQAQYDLARADWDHHVEANRKKTPLEKFIEIGGIPRAIMSSMDLSALGLQGWFSAVTHPVIAGRMLVKSVKAMYDRLSSIAYHNAIVNDPRYLDFKDAGGYIAPVEGGVLSEREEAYPSNYAERIPVLGRMIRASSRAYSTFLNGLRFEVWKTLMDSVPVDSNTQMRAKQFAKFVNISTGRASFSKGSSFDAATPFLNIFFFSVRNWVSRLQLLTAHPMWGGDAATRKIVAKEYVKFLGGASLLLLIGQLIGGEWEKDPRGSGFGKLRFKEKNGRYVTIDLTAQLGNEMTFLSRLLSTPFTNKNIKTADGSFAPMVSTKYGQEGRGGRMIWEKLRSKLSPMASLAVDASTQTDIRDKPFHPVKGVAERVSPLTAQEVLVHFNDHSVPNAGLLSLLSFFGFRPSTYDPSNR